MRLFTSKKGWLQIPIKKERRDSYEPLTDEDVMKLINYILYSPDYPPSNLPEEASQLYRLRNSAMIAMFWLFGKRLTEVLSLKTEDVWIDGDELKVRFKILKKSKKYKKCRFCEELNSRRANFCKKCGRSLSDAELVKVGQELPVRIKRKSLLNRFVSYILMWMEERKKHPSGYFFPPLSTVGKLEHDGKLVDVKLLPTRMMSRANVWYILDEFGLTPHLFRYGFAKSLLIKTHGDLRLVKEAGDWSSLDMLMEYAKSLGTTEEDEKFSRL
ncbi:MAG: site-specific integrase [Candidatus Bathyarchaeia archaeon]